MEYIVCIFEKKNYSFNPLEVGVGLDLTGISPEVIKREMGAAILNTIENYEEERELIALGVDL